MRFLSVQEKANAYHYQHQDDLKGWPAHQTVTVSLADKSENRTGSLLGFDDGLSLAAISIRY